jgi:glycosyltransferase involved in cell wall biosynthesis
LPSPASIDNGCEVPRKSIRFDEVVSEVESYKDNPHSPVFIHVARFHEQKNQNLLIDAFNELDRKGEDFVLLVIGDGFDQGPGAELKRRACAKIHFLGLKNNVADYLYCSDAFCLTSIYEGLPISLLEAMACGVVPICTNVGGIPDVIIEGVSGYLSNVGLGEYIEAIRRYRSDMITKDSIVAEFNKSYSMEYCAQCYMHLYNLN